MYNRVWTSTMSGRKQLYWHYDFDTNALKVVARRNRNILPYGFNVDSYKSFLAKFSLMVRPIFTYNNKVYCGLEVARGSFCTLYVGLCSYDILLMLKSDMPFSSLNCIDNGFMFNGFYREYGVVIVNAPLIVTKLIMDNNDFRQEVIEHMMFSAKINNVYEKISVKM